MVDAYRADDYRALRLTFTYRGEEIELVDVQEVEVFVPPGDEWEYREERSGFWVELRDDAEGVVFRQVLHHPAEAHQEVFPEDPYGEIIRQPVDSPSGAFTLILPDATQARNVVLVASPTSPERRTEVAAEVARFDMVDVRGRGRRS